MIERGVFNLLILGWFAAAGVIFVGLFFVTALYGRHSRRGWGPRIDSRLGWILMEASSQAAFAAWTPANLFPRTQAHHRWYHQHFADYPQNRKALIPGLW